MRTLPRPLSRDDTILQARDEARVLHFAKHSIGPLVIGHSSRHARRRRHVRDTSWARMTTLRKTRPTPPARPVRHRHPDRKTSDPTTSHDEGPAAMVKMTIILTTFLAIELGVPLLAGFLIACLFQLAPASEPEDERPSAVDAADGGRPPEGYVALSRLLLATGIIMASSFSAPGWSFLLGALLLHMQNPADTDSPELDLPTAPATDEKCPGGVAALVRVILLGSAV